MDQSGRDFAFWNVRFYHISMVLLLASIPLSKYTTSLFQFAVLAFWLLYESDLAYIKDFSSGRQSLSIRIPKLVAGFLKSLFYSLLSKFKAFFKEKEAMIITSLLLIHVIGLLYSSDMNYALKDLRTKLPLFLLPLFFSTGPPVNTKTLYWIYIVYIAAVVGGTIYRLFLYMDLPVADPRAINSHISHIRFSLNTVYSIFILAYFIRLQNFFKNWQKLLFAIVIVWFIIFMMYLRYNTGISILIIVSLLLLLYKALKGSTLYIRLFFLVAGLSLFTIPVLYVHSVVKHYRHTEPVNFATLDKHTVSGNSYYHDTINFRIENGRYVGLYICDKELRKSWVKRSELPIDNLDGKQQLVRYTLIRYLASKNLRKDSVGIARLDEKDIRNIEAGITNDNHKNGFDLNAQIDNFLIGWDNYVHHNNPNSSSLIQRVEYWRTSLLLIKQHTLFGVGTGDVPDAFRIQYEKMNSSLEPQFRLRSHNQFLSITVAFGVLGLLWFLFVLIYPMWITKKYKSYFYIIFWLIFTVSLITEDTIETQEGVTFFAYFTSLLLFAWKKTDEDPKE
jgi:hypothetical protein